MNRLLRAFFGPVCLLALCLCCLAAGPAAAQATGHVNKEEIYDPGHLKPTDSTLKVHVGEPAPDFTLPSIMGGTVSLSQFRGRKIVVISFVPAAFTPVCSAQWPAYNLGREEIEKRGAVIIGISSDNVPSLFAWTREMGGVWFPVGSDFHPQGATAAKYGVLRSNGTADRAEIIVDKKGIIRSIEVYDINARPKLEKLLERLDAIK
ncbi:alkyl hydroperoxide reductase/ Thiol specific antioxidant/ Mal allergen [Desulfovibrio sp. X2]|uniref:redoxin domain-containing protein n=1 Tax=Desulfovibrio sp. X2 TaxID=941449 RepID=UPI000358DB72|nr:redoxin domain-containing protein [Desulfovibrio sp. X2]EPR37582.1 alkyl hydroperoxide reductase/ Thiol specific antioxidant/ Mal allergen [Desulfovibrio sp. X2]